MKAQDDRDWLGTAAIYTPYNIIPGGGERYLLSIAEIFLKKGFKTWLVVPEIFSSIRITTVSEIFGINLSGLMITTYEAALLLPKFDHFFVMSNQIAPPVKPLGEINYYCCQFPFPCDQTEIERRRSWISDYHQYILYSPFVQEYVEREFSRQSIKSPVLSIIAPPVDMMPFDQLATRKNIVSVGRFFVGGHCKRQDILIRAFRKIHELGISISLHLIGSLPPEAEHRQYFVDCQRLAEGLPIYFHVDAPSQVLEQVYSDASIYWHGAGFEIDTSLEPEKCEHFGITVVEAMSAGVIPLVVSKGGPASIVQHGRNGFCYNSEAELIEQTLSLIFGEPEEVTMLRSECRRRALEFSKKTFQETAILTLCL